MYGLPPIFLPQNVPTHSISKKHWYDWGWGHSEGPKKEAKHPYSRAQLQIPHDDCAEGQEHTTMYSDVSSTRSNKSTLCSFCFSKEPTFQIGNTKYVGTKAVRKGKKIIVCQSTSHNTASGTKSHSDGDMTNSRHRQVGSSCLS